MSRKVLSSMRSEVAGMTAKVRALVPGAGAKQIPLFDFVAGAWSTVDPAKAFIPAPHIHAICEHLEAVARGEIQNLYISVPPGHAKSLLASVLYPAWMWLRRPSWRLLAATYSGPLTLRDALRCRQLLRSSWYQDTFKPAWTIADDQDTKGYYLNTAGGFRYSTSTTGESTGHRGDALLVDDALAADKAESEVERERTKFWWDQAFANRLNDLAKGSRVGIGQRLHEDDLYGHWLRQGGWVHLRLPSEFEAGNPCTTSIGWSDWRKEDNELLFPELFPRSVLDGEKKRLGSFGWSGQHQQRPAPASGGKFKRAWFRYFTVKSDWFILQKPDGEHGFRRSDCVVFQTVDLALGTKQTNDYTVILTGACTPENDLLILDVNRFRAEAPDVTNALQTSRLRFTPQFQAIERAHYGIAICQQWIRSGFPLMELSPDKDKVTRATVVALMMENGKVYFDPDAHWLTDFETEILTFPKSDHDDQTDTLSYAGLIVSEQMLVSAQSAYVSLGPENHYAFDEPPGMQISQAESRRLDKLLRF